MYVTVVTTVMIAVVTYLLFDSCKLVTVLVTRDVTGCYLVTLLNNFSYVAMSACVRINFTLFFKFDDSACLI